MEHTSQEHPEHNEAGSSHITPWTVYAIVFVVLLVLMGATVAASFIDLGPGNNILAMGIAIFKAALVVTFFMQVGGSSRLTKVWAALGFIWLAFLFGTLGDYLTRNWLKVLHPGW
ncbi:MAG TPA: cytochrome C oxidase subunit IV family protein [Chthonomonadaceae bacterium]|nr:cytochrome C oxidase subunit IV family protein [Chthonomonadaceae bacterium]